MLPNESLNGAKGLRKVIGNRNSRITIVYHIFHKGYTCKGVAFVFMMHYRELQVDGQALFWRGIISVRKG